MKKSANTKISSHNLTRTFIFNDFFITKKNINNKYYANIKRFYTVLKIKMVLILIITHYRF